MTILEPTIEACKTLNAPFDNYMVTEDGRVIRKEHTSKKLPRHRKDGTRDTFNKYFPQREVKDHLNKKTGYHQVSIRKTGMTGFGGFTKYVHDLVAEQFIGPRPEGYDIDHVDGNRSNNHYTNLEYVTRQENIRRAWVRRLAKEKGEYDDSRCCKNSFYGDN